MYCRLKKFWGTRLKWHSTSLPESIKRVGITCQDIMALTSVCQRDLKPLTSSAQKRKVKYFKIIISMCAAQIYWYPRCGRLPSFALIWTTISNVHNCCMEASWTALFIPVLHQSTFKVAEFEPLKQQGHFFLSCITSFRLIRYALLIATLRSSARSDDIGSLPSEHSARVASYFFSIKCLVRSSNC